MVAIAFIWMEKNSSMTRRPTALAHDDARSSAGGPRLSDSHGILAHLVGGHRAAPLVAPSLSEEAVNAARKADVVIAVVGITAQFEGEESDSSDPGFSWRSPDLNLPRPQQELLESVAATGKPLIVVSPTAARWP